MKNIPEALRSFSPKDLKKIPKSFLQFMRDEEARVKRAKARQEQMREAFAGPYPATLFDKVGDREGNRWYVGSLQPYTQKVVGMRPVYSSGGPGFGVETKLLGKDDIVAWYEKVSAERRPILNR